MLLLLLAIAYTSGIVWPRAQVVQGSPHFDTYGYFYPNLRYALDSLARGHGLLWNRFQNCGQPFFAISLTGLLYPPFALGLVLAPHRLLLVLLALHLAIAGLGTYALARALGVGVLAGLLGAMAFELGASTLWNGLWAPNVLAVCAWMPVALAFSERLLRAPSLATTAGLAAALALQWLIGYPQVSLFTYQVIGLRLVWEVISRGRSAPWRAMALIVTAGAVAPLACAVQLIPAAEVARESIRQRPLTLAEIRPPTLTLTWTQFRQFVQDRYSYGALFPLTGLLLISVCWTGRAQRRMAVFYTGVAALYFALTFDNPVFRLYIALPLGGAFREPHRFLWVTACTGSVAIALGADRVLARRADRPGRRPWGVLVTALAALLIAWWLPLGRLGAARLLVIGAAGALCWVAATARPRLRAAAGLGLLALLGAELVDDSSRQVFTLLADDARLMAHAPAFAAARERMTLQDRLYLIAGEEAARWGGIEEGLMKKAAQLFRVPSIADYEPQTSYRYAQYLIRMLYDRPMASINEFVFELRWVPRNRALFDRTAARFVVIDGQRAAQLHWPTDDYRLVWSAGDQRLYENPRALPRARWVPLVQAVGDADEVLRRLSLGLYDARQLALLEGPPGEPLGSATGSGTARITSDEGERLVVEVDADAPGFLFVADQAYPSWTAMVDGVPATVQRADFAFRLVAVPAGRSTVEFRYRPRSLALGAAVSGLTLGLAGAVAAWWGRRGRWQPGSRRQAAGPDRNTPSADEHG